MKHLKTTILAALGILAGALNPAQAVERANTIRPDTAVVPEMRALRAGLVRGAEFRLGRDLDLDLAGNERRPAAATGIGGVAGALLGAVAFSLAVDWAECARPESMCGLSAPIYVGSGALVGAVAGYFFDLGRADASA